MFSPKDNDYLKTREKNELQSALMIMCRDINNVVMYRILFPCSIQLRMISEEE